MILIDALITVAPLIGLYSQYSLIKQRKHIGSFSIDIIGILFISNILRIMFWFSKGFADNLLIQSFVVISMGFALLDLCVSVGYKRNNSLTDFSHVEDQSFWRWSKLTPFVLFVSFFTFFMSILTYFFVHFDIKIYGQIVGLVSVGVDCTMGLPQLVNNQKARSVQGLSMLMIGTWFLGDFSKTIYFIAQAQPLQFIIGGAIQLFIDLLIVIQIMAFRQNYQTVKGNYDSEMQDQIQTSNGDTQTSKPIDQAVKRSIYSKNDSPMKFSSMSIKGI